MRCLRYLSLTLGRVDRQPAPPTTASWPPTAGGAYGAFWPQN